MGPVSVSSGVQRPEVLDFWYSRAEQKEGIQVPDGKSEMNWSFPLFLFYLSPQVDWMMTIHIEDTCSPLSPLRLPCQSPLETSLQTHS